jgi:hypothetical protein
MASLNLDLNYPNHPKVKRLVGLLGKGADILPIRLWLYVGKFHAADGRLIGYSPQEIETQIEWWGKQGACVDALIKVVLLEAIEGGYQVHDWLTHAGHIHALKLHASNMAKKKWADMKAKALLDANSNATSMLTALPQAMPTNVVGNAGSKEESVKEGGVGGESTPKGSHAHPLLSAMREKSGNPRLRWVPISNLGIEEPTDLADTMAEADRIIKKLTIGRLTEILCRVGGKTIKDRMARAKRDLDEAEKTAQKANTAQTGAVLDWSHMVEGDEE